MQRFGDFYDTVIRPVVYDNESIEHFDRYLKQCGAGRGAELEAALARLTAFCEPASSR